MSPEKEKVTEESMKILAEEEFSESYIKSNQIELRVENNESFFDLFVTIEKEQSNPCYLLKDYIDAS